MSVPAPPATPATPAAPDRVRAGLDGRVRAWIAESSWSRDDRRFEALCSELFAYQFARCTPYRRYCEALGRTPQNVTRWQDVPAVPTGSFKEVALRCFPEEATRQTFRTSGTSTARRGALHLDTLALYDASLRASFERFVLPDLVPGERCTLRVLAPCAAEAPDSSLSYMFDAALREWGDPHSGWDVVAGALQAEPLCEALIAAAERGAPLAVCGTAWAFVHLLEHLESAGRRIVLPPGARVMETGGYKGRVRALPRDELYARIEERLGVPPARCLNQYGMTELGSQFYDAHLRLPGCAGKPAPPWTRVRLIDPESGEDVAEGETGVVVIVDLANTGSVCAVETADLGLRRGDGFDVLGRQEGAEARGCSIAADAMLGPA